MDLENRIGIKIGKYLMEILCAEPFYIRTSANNMQDMQACYDLTKALVKNVREE